MTGRALLSAGALGGVAAFARSLLVRERRRHQAVERQNAQLLGEARVRDAERSRLSEQVITAEQDERRRLGLFLHDTAVQSLSGITLMLDASQHALAAGRAEEAGTILDGALERQRETIRSLRALSFELEPVVLRDQGVGAAVRALADQLALTREVAIEVDVEAAESLGEKAQAGLYQIIREALHQAERRGPPKRISIRVTPLADGEIETVISDDGSGERRRANLDVLAERARTLSGELSVTGGSGGTSVRVVIPAYTAR